MSLTNPRSPDFVSWDFSYPGTCLPQPKGLKAQIIVNEIRNKLKKRVTITYKASGLRYVYMETEERIPFDDSEVWIEYIPETKTNA